MTIHIANRPVGPGHPCYLVAEIGINHNGDLELAKQLVDVAAEAGCDAVKVQVRTPELCVPRDQWDVPRVPPWGGPPIPYIEYKRRMELSDAQLHELHKHAIDAGITLFASEWDLEALKRTEALGFPAHKVPSAKLTDSGLVMAAAQTDKALILSTGMSSEAEVDTVVGLRPRNKMVVLHSVSAYPCPTTELNLGCLETMRRRFRLPYIGYSGHETGLAPSIAAVVLGACMLERHITLDRAMPGTDHAASLEPDGLRRLVRDVRVVEQSMGDGVKRRLECELPAWRKLRGE